MENIDLNIERKDINESDEFSMNVSPICIKNGTKIAFVSFTDNTRIAEGVIPDCKIVKNTGFTEDEVVGLELYMKAQLPMLKRMAAGVNILNRFMDEKI